MTRDQFAILLDVMKAKSYPVVRIADIIDPDPECEQAVVALPRRSCRLGSKVLLEEADLGDDRLDCGKVGRDEFGVDRCAAVGEVEDAGVGDVVPRGQSLTKEI